MFLHRKSTNLISKAKEVALVVHPHPHIMPSPTIRSSAANLTRTMAAINKDDNAIQNIVLESSWFKASKSLCAYVSSPALLEVGTSRIISEVLSSSAKERKKLYVPRVEDRNSNMKMLMISSVKDLIEKSMNILEPALVDSDGNQREDGALLSLFAFLFLFKAANYLEVSGAVMQASDPVDLFIVPGLAFDKSGSRLGRSGGWVNAFQLSGCYYDLFLKNYQELTKKKRWKQPLLVALSYSVQIIEDGVIPVTPFDIPMDAFVSPAGFIPISGAALRRCE
ncbi:hypothetical protein Goari_006025 [Gossypium aridum]|uniref:5-formyltetrahydrofolate cyclo-ligase n=1 Tax=Gossypium aridum TaxID=34290 RepID=A0A7J8XLZ4_GOSAI|nr:hypothetical protein [Gossypium aridum]